MTKKSYWLSISAFVLMLIWTIYYYAMRYTGGFADLKDTIICGVVGLICVIFIVKRTINFLKRKKSWFSRLSRRKWGRQIGIWGKERMEDKKPVNKKLMVLPLILGISSFCTFALYFYSANHAPYTYTDIILVGPILSFIGVIVTIITRRSRKLYPLSLIHIWRCRRTG